MLQSILSVVTRLLAVALQVLGLANLIRDEGAREHAPFALETIAANGTNTVINPTYGNSALHTQLTAGVADILAAIANITSPGGGGAVNLPVNWAMESATAIWQYEAQNAIPGTVSMDQLLTWAGQFAASYSNQGGFPMKLAPGFVLETGFAETWAFNTIWVDRPEPDWAAISSNDTVLSWLNRTDVTYAGMWLYDALSDTCHVHGSGGGLPSWDVRCVLRTADLQALRSSFNADGIVAILGHLTAIRGPSSLTLADLVTTVQAVRGAGNPDLAAVLAAIAAVRGSGQPDLAGVLAAIAAVRGSGNPDLAALVAALAIVDTHVLRRPPIWPGLANVTLGSPVAVATSVSIDVPMHGILVAFTAIPPGRSAIHYGDQDAWPKVAFLTFGSDGDDYEYQQTVSWESGVYLPKTMVQASHLRFNALPGVVGTITPFAVT